MEAQIKSHSASSVQACQQCHKNFTIAQEDFNFYEKMKVPAPTWCPECRMIRRFTSQNAPYLFYENCAKCQKEIYTPYAPEDPRIVYCVACYQAEFA